MLSALAMNEKAGVKVRPVRMSGGAEPPSWRGSEVISAVPAPAERRGMRAERSGANKCRYERSVGVYEYNQANVACLLHQRAGVSSMRVR